MLILKPHSIDRSVAGANIPAVTFIAHAGLPARELAHMLDSLVRVSRRVEGNHLVNVLVSEVPSQASEQAQKSEPPPDVVERPDTHQSVRK